jgi:molybdopterin/thiamine biosynthesis adenylyltransferase
LLGRAPARYVSLVSTSLSEKSALVIGTGGLGGPALYALAAAGVGRIVLMDADAVETSNLNRQPFFGESDLGGRKAVVAAMRLRALRPEARIEARDERFGEVNAAELVRGVDVVLDGSDNFATKFLANDAAVAARKPLVHGGILRTTAQIMTIVPGPAGCLRCLFEAPPPADAMPSNVEAGVLGSLAGFAGTLMAAEAVRLLAGERGSYVGRLLSFEATSARGRLVMVRRREACPACGRSAPDGTREGA